jgi:hypothetical protein
MYYVLNTGRYDYSFQLEIKGRETKVNLIRRRYFYDTGNIATTGITPVKDDVFAVLKEQAFFKDLMAKGEISLTDEASMHADDSEKVALAEENKKLKEELAKAKKAEPKKDDKEMKKLADENASLKAQLESLTKKGKKADKDETEGF